MTTTITEAIKEIMKQYDEKRAEWIIKYGNDEGFDAYFNTQVKL